MKLTWTMLTAKGSVNFYQRKPLANGGRTCFYELHNVMTHISKCWYVWLAIQSPNYGKLHTGGVLKNSKFINLVNFSIDKGQFVAEDTPSEEEVAV